MFEGAEIALFLLVRARILAMSSLNSKGFARFAPVIALEVKSPDDRESQIARKLAIYLAAGVAEVWWVRPAERTVTIHRPESVPRTFANDDTFNGSSVLPGFELSLSELFTM